MVGHRWMLDKQVNIKVEFAKILWVYEAGALQNGVPQDGGAELRVGGGARDKNTAVYMLHWEISQVF